jgi:hypothetical protein
MSQWLNVVFEEISRSDSPGFRDFYAMYEAAFPIADEREPPEAFDAILALNSRLPLQQAQGPYRELVVAIRAWEGGPVIGGHVFGITTSQAHHACGIAASVQGIYTFLHPEFRGAVPIRSLANYSQEVAARVFQPVGFCPRHPPPILFEVNNPLRMSAQEIEMDTRLSGTDPFRRYLFWRRSGFRPLEFPYVQPRLREDAQPIRYLDLFCTHGGLDSLPARLLQRHLGAFLSVSVFKGIDAAVDPDCDVMHRWLDGRATVEFRDIAGGDSAVIANHLRQRARQV